MRLLNSNQDHLAIGWIPSKSSSGQERVTTEKLLQKCVQVEEIKRREHVFQLADLQCPPKRIDVLRTSHLSIIFSCSKGLPFPSVLYSICGNLEMFPVSTTWSCCTLRIESLWQLCLEETTRFIVDLGDDTIKLILCSNSIAHRF